MRRNQKTNKNRTQWVLFSLRGHWPHRCRCVWFWPRFSRLMLTQNLSLSPRHMWHPYSTLQSILSFYVAWISLFRGPNSVTRVLLNTESGHGFQRGRKKQRKKGETRSGHPRAASTCRQTDFQLKNATIWGVSGSGDVCAYILSVTLSTLKFYYQWNFFLSNLGVMLNLELTCTVSQSDNWCGQWI